MKLVYFVFTEQLRETQLQIEHYKGTHEFSIDSVKLFATTCMRSSYCGIQSFLIIVIIVTLY